MAKDLGYSIKFEYIDGNNGEFSLEDKTLIISPKLKKTTFLFSLAHEIRHALHVEQQLYTQYYLFSSGQSERFNAGLFIRAERDCDKWASKFLEGVGIEYVKESLYEMGDVSGGHDYYLRLRYLKSKYDIQRTEK